MQKLQTFIIQNQNHSNNRLHFTGIVSVNIALNTVTMRVLAFLIFCAAVSNCSPKLSPDATWGRQQWAVVEMKGVPVQQSGGRRDAHIVFEITEKKFRGNGGCNQINGTYDLDKKEIHFTDVIATKMSCEDIDFENVFLTELGRVDRYESNGNELRLKRRNETLLVLRSR